MKRTLINCDQVFDVLTRGPFPTGEPEDEAVEQHLRACHECRQLAEALRPAVALLHEVVTAEEAIDLPEYQGSLASDEPRRLGVVRLATASVANRESRAKRRKAEPSDKLARAQWLLSAARFGAVSVLAVAAALLLLAIALAPREGNRELGIAGRTTRDSVAVPSDEGLLTLASLKLPVACLPLTHRPLSPEHAAQIAVALADGSLGRLHCCTECHHAGSPRSRVASVAMVSTESCQSCHQG